MLKFLEKFERVIVILLVAMLTLVIVLSTLELAWIIFQDMITPPILILDIRKLLDLFGFFLLILIGIELIESIQTYLTEKVVHTETVLMVAIIALARKIIILNTKEYPGETLIGLALLILALAVAYYLVKRAHIAIK